MPRHLTDVLDLPSNGDIQRRRGGGNRAGDRKFELGRYVATRHQRRIGPVAEERQSNGTDDSKPDSQAYREHAGNAPRGLAGLAGAITLS